MVGYAVAAELADVLKGMPMTSETNVYGLAHMLCESFTVGGVNPTSFKDLTYGVGGGLLLVVMRLVGD